MLRTLSLFLIITSLAFLVDSAYAQDRGANAADPNPAATQQRRIRLDQDESLRPAVDANRAQAQIERQARLKQRCEVVGRSMSQYQARHELNSNAHVNAFRRVEVNIAKMVARLENSPDIDTSRIRQLLGELTAQIDAFESNNDRYISTLQELPTLACSEGDEDLRGVLQSTKTALRQLRAEALAIRSFIQNAIRPELLQLREQVAQSDSE